MRFVTYFACFLLLWQAARTAEDLDPIVKTSLGQIQGKLAKVQLYNQEKTVYTFFGVPFAEPPIGELRFKKPRPAQSWDGIYDATNMSKMCVQSTKAYEMFNISVRDEAVSEDCLYLNIWTPNYLIDKKEDLKPVIVYIHGGAFVTGSGSQSTHDGQVLSSVGDLVVVTVNYRLGLLGLINFGHEESPGNQGLWDQWMALIWVREHIRDFGGNPDYVTLAGVSAGSISVGIHLVSPVTQGLYHRGIMQSGGPLGPAFLDTVSKAQKSAMDYAETQGCHTSNKVTQEDTDTKAIIECLRKLDVAQILKFQEENNDIFGMKLSFVPTYGDEFYPIEDYSYVVPSDNTPVDVMIGLTPDEGSFMIVVPLILKEIAENRTTDFNLEVAKFFAKGPIVAAPEEDAEEAVRFYFRDVPEDASTDFLKKLAATLPGDYVLTCPAVYFAERFSRRKNNVYFYVFSHRSSVSPWEEWTGVNHGDDVYFAFGFPLLKDSNYRPEEIKFSEEFMDLWASFANSRKPQVPGIDTWPLYSEDRPVFVDLKPDNYTTGIGPRLTHCNFWRCRWAF